MNRDTIRALMMIWSGLCACFVLVSVAQGAADKMGTGVCCGLLAFGPALAAWVVGMIVLGLSMLMFKEAPTLPPELPTDEPQPPPPPAPKSAEPTLPPMSADQIGVAVVGLLVFGFLAYQIYVYVILRR